jgi:hypothetical protein
MSVLTTPAEAAAMPWKVVSVVCGPELPEHGGHDAALALHAVVVGAREQLQMLLTVLVHGIALVVIAPGAPLPQCRHGRAAFGNRTSRGCAEREHEAVPHSG